MVRSFWGGDHGGAASGYIHVPRANEDNIFCAGHQQPFAEIKKTHDQGRLGQGVD